MCSFEKTNVGQAKLPTQPLVSHVNMQIDSFLANSTLEDLRSIVRNVLATGPAGTTSCFTKVARRRISNTYTKRVAHPSMYFTVDEKTGETMPTSALKEASAAARTLMGTSLGFEALPILTTIMDTARAYEWDVGSDFEDAMVTLDADIAQAMQSCREQIRDKLVQNPQQARKNLDNLREMLSQTREDFEAWGNVEDFPLEKAELAVQGDWKLGSDGVASPSL